MSPAVAEAVMWWRGNGVSPAEVWESVQGRPPRHPPTWSEVGELLDDYRLALLKHREAA